MKENKTEIKQLRTVTNLFVEYDIDLSLVPAGKALYRSLRNARYRTRNREEYKAKGIEFRFHREDRLAVIEVIRGDKEFLQAWINQYGIYERSGLESDQPSIHRLNPDGHYEFGNIGVLPYGEHLRENAIPTAMILLENGSFSFQVNWSEIDTAKSIGIGKGQVKTLKRRGYTVSDKATGADTGQVAIAMSIRTSEPTNSEAGTCSERDAHMISNVNAGKYIYDVQLEALINGLR